MKTILKKILILTLFFAGCGKKARVIEFLDYQCPSCKRAEEWIERLRGEFGKKLVWEIKHLPIRHLHPYAEQSAIAAECARDQGKFWQMHKKLFTKSPALKKENILSLAAEIGLDMSKFIPCLDSEDKRELINENIEEAKRLGISATPSFIIEKEIITGAPPYDTLRKIIQDIISGKKFRHSSVRITVVTDPSCPTCGTTKMVSELKQVFFNNEVKTFTVKDEEGKKILDKYNITWLPAILMSGEIEDYVNSYLFIPLRVIHGGDSYILNPGFYQIGYSRDVPPQNPETTFGEKNAPIKIIHFTGFGNWCIGCYEAYSIIKRSLKGFEKYVSLTYKIFAPDPDHPSYPPAMAVLCAGEQGKFDEMFLMIHESKVADNFEEKAKKSGVKDLKKFRECFEGRKYAQLLINFTNEAFKFWVPYAPYTFVNNYRFPDIPNPDWLHQLIEDLVRLHELGVDLK